MASIEEIVSDLEATVDYVRGEITQRSDQLALQDAVLLSDRLEKVKQTVAEAISLLTTQELKLLEGGSQQIGSKVYASVPKTVARTDHEYVRKAVIDHAVNAAECYRDTGQPIVTDVARQAVDAMMKLYVSPSRNATKSGLKRIGAKVGKALFEEDQGRKVQIVDLAAKQAEDDDDE